MKYLGTIQDPKDLITKEYVDDADAALSTRINTNEDNITMAESDIESLQGDVSTLKTDNTSIKSAIQTLQDTYVPNTRKVNGKALDSDITLTASDVGALESTYKPTFVVNVRTISTGLSADKTFEEITNAYNNGYDVYCMFADLYLIHLKLITSNGIQFSSSSFSGNYLQSKVSWYTLTVSSSNKWQYQSGDNVVIPTKTSNLTNDSGFLTSAPVTSVNNKTGAVTLDASDVGALPSTTPIPDIKVVTNVSCPLFAWVSDTTTYTDYQFKANLTVTDATADYIPLVNFAPTEQESGNYIGATSGNGIVTIWCKNKPSGAITIPNIILIKKN